MIKRGLWIGIASALALALGGTLVGCGDDAEPAVTKEKCLAEGFNESRMEIVRTLIPGAGDEATIKDKACTCALAAPSGKTSVGAMGGALSTCLGQMAAENLGM